MGERQTPPGNDPQRCPTARESAGGDGASEQAPLGNRPDPPPAGTPALALIAFRDDDERVAKQRCLEAVASSYGWTIVSLRAEVNEKRGGGRPDLEAEPLGEALARTRVSLLLTTELGRLARFHNERGWLGFALHHGLVVWDAGRDRGVSFEEFAAFSVAEEERARIVRRLQAGRSSADGPRRLARRRPG